MKKIAIFTILTLFVSLASIASKFDSKIEKIEAKTLKTIVNTNKKTLSNFAGCRIYPLTSGYQLIGDKMVCTDLNGNVTVIYNYY